MAAGIELKISLQFCKIQSDVYKQTHALKWMVLLQLNFCKSKKQIKAHKTCKYLILKVCKSFKNVMT